MERTKYLLMIMLLFSGFVKAQTNCKSTIYKAFISNDMAKWKSTMDNMNSQKNKSNTFILELVNYQYGYIAWCIGNDKTDDAEKYLEIANKNIEYLEKQNFQISYAYSYKSAFYGFEIGLAWYKAPFIGPRSVGYSEKAMNTDKNNPFGYIQYANSQYYMPETFGGSKTVAIQYYITAQKLMEADTSFTKNNWNYISLLTTIAQAYTETKKYVSAKEYYEKILKIEPDFGWVKNELYPKLKKKL